MKSRFLIPNKIIHKFLIFLFLIIGLTGFSGCAINEIDDPDLKQTTNQQMINNQSTSGELTDQFMNIYQDKNSGEINGYNCNNSENQTMAKSISQTFNFEDEEIMAWHCDGYNFEDILIAIETWNATEVPVAELLEKSKNQEWEEIWEEIGLLIEN